MRHRVWVLGAPDPEMEQIERLLRQCGEEIIYATGEDGRRVHPGNAYRCPVPAVPEGATVYAVECIDVLPEGWVRIDHHRPGDPGYGRPPDEFLSASSIGQVIRALARLGAIPSSWRRMSAGWAAPLTPQYAEDGTPVDYVGVPWARPAAGGWDAWDIVIDANTFARVPQEIVYAAAADHCLAAAYRGECPGVELDALMRWRAASRAAFQRRAVEDVLADVERARAALREAPVVSLAEGIHARDLRGPAIPELPEAAAREGECFLASLRERDGKTKVVCQSGTPEQIEAFMRVWAPAQGLTDIYGDQARGFAGGYLQENTR